MWREWDLKVLFFNWRDITHPQAGGCELHLHEIAKRLTKKGHEVTVYTTDVLDKKNRLKFQKIRKINKLNAHYIGYNELIKLNENE